MRNSKIKIYSPDNYTVYPKSLRKVINCSFTHKVIATAYNSYLNIKLNGKLYDWGNEVYTNLLDQGIYNMTCKAPNLHFQSFAAETFSFIVIGKLTAHKMFKFIFKHLN